MAPVPTSSPAPPSHADGLASLGSQALHPLPPLPSVPPGFSHIIESLEATADALEAARISPLGPVPAPGQPHLEESCGLSLSQWGGGTPPGAITGDGTPSRHSSPAASSPLVPRRAQQRHLERLNRGPHPSPLNQNPPFCKLSGDSQGHSGWRSALPTVGLVSLSRP